MDQPNRATALKAAPLGRHGLEAGWLTVRIDKTEEE